MASSRGEAGIMPQDMVQYMVSSPSPPQMRCCGKCRIGLTSGYLLLACNCLCALCDWFCSLGLSKEPAMNGTAGFQAVRSSTSRSPYRFLHEQRHQFGTGAWHPLHTHDLIALFTGISTTREKISDALPSPTIAILSVIAHAHSYGLIDRWKDEPACLSS